MTAALERRVRRRARQRCEYCHLPQFASNLTFPIDHVIARQHGGRTRAENLALSCVRCNSHKGPNIAGIDPESEQLVPLFHPRRDRWIDHFEWQGAELIGKTPTARATIVVLSINGAAAVARRAALIAEGLSPD
jgi:hypothetical protein